jgi:transposase
VITTAVIDEVIKNAWCREHGVFPMDLDKWRATATAALGASETMRASTQTSQQDRKRIKELERNLLRKDRALAETAALLVLSKKAGAIFNTSVDA